jgi:putative tryptophan/tyrosine transport system substrate-binding protein
MQFDQLKRREFITLLGSAAAWPSIARAQQSSSARRVAVLMGFPEADAHAQAYVLAFREKLENLGWVENRNLQIVYRWGGGDPEKTRAYARELIGMAPNVIVASTNQATEIVRRETASIPIVFASLGDPVGSGLVASLARPGGNVTGFPAFVETMGAKWLELLKEIAASVERVGFVFHPDVAPHRGLLRAALSAATSMKIELLPIPVHDARDIELGIRSFASVAGGGLVSASHAVTYSNRDLIIRLASTYRLPTVFASLFGRKVGGYLRTAASQLRCSVERQLMSTSFLREQLQPSYRFNYQLGSF